MKMIIYMEIDDNAYEKYRLEQEFRSKIKHILTDIESKAYIIYNPIVYKDDYSKEIEIK